MPHTYSQHLSRAIKGSSKAFGREFKKRPFYTISRIPHYFLITLIGAQIYHLCDMPTVKELEFAEETAKQRINQLEGLLLKLDHRDN
ncbi:MAG: hypothetical protein AABX50_01630 [Nanoarchaeota archaeon]